MGLRLAGDPSWGYRLSPAELVSVLALERVEAAERAAPAQPGHAGVPVRPSAAFLSHPNVAPCSPAAARFWSTP